WMPPEGISPALANYIEQRGFRGEGWDAFAASVIDLAVKEHVEIDQPGKTMSIRRKGSGMPGALGAGQRAILAALPADGDSLKMCKASRQDIQKMGRAFREAIEKEHRGQFYRANTFHVALGALASVMLAAYVVATGGMSPDAI